MDEFGLFISTYPLAVFLLIEGPYREVPGLFLPYLTINVWNDFLELNEAIYGIATIWKCTNMAKKIETPFFYYAADRVIHRALENVFICFVHQPVNVTN